MNSCFAPAKFLKRHSKEVWKPSSLIHPARSNQPPSRTCPPLPGPPSRSRSPSSRLKLPGDPPRALPGSPEPPPPPPPAAPHVLGARVAAGPTHRLRASHLRVSSRGPVGTKPKRPGQGRRAGARMGTAAPACTRRSHAPCAPGPYTATGTHRATRPSPGRWAAAWAPRRARPPPGRFLSSPPHPDPPAAPFLTGGLGGAEGADSGGQPPPRPGPGSPPPSPRAPASRGKQESVRGRGKGTDAEGKGKPRSAAPTRDPLRSGANNSLLKHQGRGQQEL
nr:basic proline-rich protein-like [Pan troglodytes]